MEQKGKLVVISGFSGAGKGTLMKALLAAHPDTAGTVGVVRYLPELEEIQGWAIDLRNLQTTRPY